MHRREAEQRATQIGASLSVERIEKGGRRSVTYYLLDHKPPLTRYSSKVGWHDLFRQMADADRRAAERGQ
jgi:hypothetical protein